MFIENEDEEDEKEFMIEMISCYFHLHSSSSFQTILPSIAESLNKEKFLSMKEEEIQEMKEERRIRKEKRREKISLLILGMFISYMHTSTSVISTICIID